MGYFEKSLIKRNYYLIKKLFYIGIIVIFSGCFSIKPGSVKSGHNLYETFYVGEEGTQYFIKPICFSDKLKDLLIIDFTFRYKDVVKDSATVNISLNNKEIIKNVDSLMIKNNICEVPLKNLKHLFTERKKTKNIYRLTTKASLVAIKKLFENNDWNIILYKQNGLSKYTFSKGSRKKINKLNFEIFTIF